MLPRYPDEFWMTLPVCLVSWDNDFSKDAEYRIGKATGALQGFIQEGVTE